MSTGGRISSEKRLTDSSRSSQIERGAAFHMLLPPFIPLESGPHAATAPQLRGSCILHTRLSAPCMAHLDMAVWESGPVLSQRAMVT